MSEHDAHGALAATAAERRAITDAAERERRKQSTVGKRHVCTCSGRVIEALGVHSASCPTRYPRGPLSDANLGATYEQRSEEYYK